MSNRPPLPVENLAWWAGWLAVAELVLLRIGTRTLVHIPGTDVLAGPMAWLAEAGRSAYYLSVVLIVLVGGALMVAWWAREASRRWLVISALVIFAVAALGGALDVLAPVGLGWVSMAALGLLILGSAGAGIRALPVVLWAGAAWSNGLAILLQGRGGGLTGEAVAGLLQTADVLVVAGALTFPLLLGTRPAGGPLLVGLTVAGVVAALLTWASSTTAILVLWAFGITASLPPILYGLAAGGMAVTVQQAVHDGDRRAGAAALLVTAGGIGLISSYQTALLLVGLTLAVYPIREEVASVPARERVAAGAL